MWLLTHKRNFCIRSITTSVSDAKKVPEGKTPLLCCIGGQTESNRTEEYKCESKGKELCLDSIERAQYVPLMGSSKSLRGGKQRSRQSCRRTSDSGGGLTDQVGAADRNTDVVSLICTVHYWMTEISGSL